MALEYGKPSHKQERAQKFSELVNSLNLMGVKLDASFAKEFGESDDEATIEVHIVGDSKGKIEIVLKTLSTMASKRQGVIVSDTGIHENPAKKPFDTAPKTVEDIFEYYCTIQVEFKKLNKSSELPLAE